MRVPSLVKDYSKLSDSNLDFRAESVILSLTGNANFPETVPTLANFTATHTAFVTALQNTVTGGRTEIALKNEARGELIAAMKQLALNIESLAPGDRPKLTSSGFELASDGENVPSIPAPADFKIADGANPGELKFSVRGVPQAVSYIHEYTEGPVTEDSKWVTKVSSTREHTFTGIRSGIRVYGRTAIVGRKGQEVYSATLTRVVQ